MNNRVDPQRADLPGHLIRAAVAAGKLTARHPLYRKATDRAFWENLPEETKAGFLAAANEYRDMVWPGKKISDYMDYFSPGERVRGSDLSDMKRHALCALVYGECVAHTGEYLPDVINGIFSFCEESTWAIPAHFHSCGSEPRVCPDGTDPVPDVDCPIVDLRTGTTADIVAFALYSLRDELDAISPVIARRVRAEIEKRFLTPYLERDNLWYMGFETDTSIWSINNWTTHMNRAAVSAALSLGDADLARKVILRAAESLDIYIDLHAADGYCDEGPSYWNAAGATMIFALSLIDSAVAGGGEILRLPRVRALAEFIADVHVTGDRFIAYADAVAHMEPTRAYRIYAVGELTDSDVIRDTARAVMGAVPPPFGVLSDPDENMFRLFYEKDLLSPARKTADRCRYYESGQALFATRGDFTLFAKGGHNHESHNHNDTGSYQIEIGGEPVAVDPGDDDYTKNLFDERYRYGIWFTRSRNHNVPLPGGNEQQTGAAHRAENVRFRETADEVSLSMDLTAAYPAGTPALSREIRLTADALTVTERCGGETEFTVVTPCAVEKDGEDLLLGKARLSFTGCVYTGAEPIENRGKASVTECFATLTRLSFRTENAGTVTFRYTKR